MRLESMFKGVVKGGNFKIAEKRQQKIAAHIVGQSFQRILVYNCDIILETTAKCIYWALIGQSLHTC